MLAQLVESACNTGDPGSFPELGRSPGEVNGNPLQYSCLGNPMDRGAWRATVHRVAKQLDTTWQPNNNTAVGIRNNLTLVTETTTPVDAHFR